MTKPVWRQLHDQLLEQAANGTLPAGHRLEPVRAMAAELDLAPGTVARAISELEALGIVETRGRHGTFVTVAARKVKDDVERTAVLAEGASALARAARQVGASEKEAKAAFVEAFRSIS